MDEERLLSSIRPIFPHQVVDEVHLPIRKSLCAFILRVLGSVLKQRTFMNSDAEKLLPEGLVMISDYANV